MSGVEQVPLLRLLRQETGANGPANIPEFGTVKDPDRLKALFDMAAYDHVVSGTRYPATLVTASANDPRVDPWQGAKMASRLQAANAGPNRPLQFRYMESVSEPIPWESLRSANLRIEVVNDAED